MNLVKANAICTQNKLLFNIRIIMYVHICLTFFLRRLYEPSVKVLSINAPCLLYSRKVEDSNNITFSFRFLKSLQKSPQYSLEYFTRWPRFCLRIYSVQAVSCTKPPSYSGNIEKHVFSKFPLITAEQNFGSTKATTTKD